MSLPTADPGRAAEVARLADAFDIVPSVFAAVAGYQFDEMSPFDASVWTFAGGEMAITWRDDAAVYFGGAETSEESRFGGVVSYSIRPTMEGQRLSYRRAALLLALRTLRDQGSQLATIPAYLALGDAVHVSPAGEDEPSVVIEVPFQLRIHLQILAPFEDVG